MNMVCFSIHMSETPSSVKVPVPELRQHTDEVLLDLGCSCEDIGRLKEEQ
jgi:crotonobetainyl-CoA:carnitine CoA-transferase CaiB-like acyl-CoA transferase